MPKSLAKRIIDTMNQLDGAYSNFPQTDEGKHERNEATWEFHTIAEEVADLEARMAGLEK